MRLGKSGRWVGTRTGAGVTHTSVKLIGRSPWLYGHRRQNTSVSTDPWAAAKKALVAVTPSPVWPTAACSEFHVDCRKDREVFTFPYATADAHGALG